MTVAEQIRQKRESIIESMLDLRDRSIETSLAESRQFLMGFVGLVEAAADGDYEPRDAYLGTVIPGVKGAGFPFDATLDSMVRVAMALTAVLGAEHHVWLADFCGDYTRRLMHAWERG